MKLPQVTHYGEIDINGFKIKCYNLDSGERVLSREGLLRAIGRTGKPKYKENVVQNENLEVFQVPIFLSAANLKDFISNELIESSKPILLQSGKQKLYGFKATILPSVCYVFIDAEKKGVLTKNQEAIAERCHLLVRGFATVGIIALIDEATGFQEIRKKEALQEILKKYLLKEYVAWAKRFPDEFYDEMFRLKNWKLDKKTMKMPQVVGRYTNDVIYDRLAPGVLEELKKRNPVIIESGRRKSKHHQWLTEDIGHPSLDRHFIGVMALMRASTSWDGFKRSLEIAYPRIGDQLALQFNDDDKE